MAHDARHATFGVVIPTWNAGEHLERLLASINGQTRSDYAIVVVDQQSNDNTTDIARRYGCSIINMPPTKGYIPPSHSRNIGAKSLDCQILLHLDADMELGSADFLERLSTLLDQQHQAVIIREVDITEGFWGHCKALERSCYPGSGLEAARAVEHELFSAVGGYDERITTGEDLFVTRQYERRTGVRRSNSLFVQHNLGRPTFASLLRKKFSYGMAAEAYLRTAERIGARSGGAIIGASIKAYARNWRLIISDPLHYMAIFPLRAAEFGAMSLGMLAVRIRQADPH